MWPQQTLPGLVTLLEPDTRRPHSLFNPPSIPYITNHPSIPGITSSKWLHGARYGPFWHTLGQNCAKAQGTYGPHSLFNPPSIPYITNHPSIPGITSSKWLHGARYGPFWHTLGQNCAKAQGTYGPHSLFNPPSIPYLTNHPSIHPSIPGITIR